MTIRLAVAGVSGRMGQMLMRAADEAEGAVLCAATEAPGHPWTGQDLGDCLGTAPRGITVTADVAAAMDAADVLLDFTIPAATLAHAAQMPDGKVHVIGTTGFSDAEITALEAHAQKAVQIRAGNMSLGVNLLTDLVKRVAGALGDGFDIEVVEMHHRHKIDAPSGTALMLGEAAAEGRGVALADMRDSGRDGITGARREGAIGFAALRGGDVVGEHSVIFAGAGERVVLQHIATDRMLFARGAIRAALWGHGKPSGAYNMQDVLGL